MFLNVNSDIVGGILLFFTGLIFSINHKKLGNYTTDFRENVMKKIFDSSFYYGENVREFNRNAFAVLGVFSVISGILFFLRGIN
jgi:hypothetical protein